MRRPDPQRIFGSYAVAWVYLAGFVITETICVKLSPHDRSAFTAWASTSVHNLQHDPVGSLVVSAFVTQGYWLAWPFLIALALFGAHKALGKWRTAAGCPGGD